MLSTDFMIFNKLILQQPARLTDLQVQFLSGGQFGGSIDEAKLRLKAEPRALLCKSPAGDLMEPPPTSCRNFALAEAEAPILWPPDVKSQLIRKDPDAGKD